MDFEYWSLIFTAISALIFLIGFLTGKKLPSHERDRRTKQSAALAMVPFFLFVLFSAPYVSSVAAVYSESPSQKLENSSDSRDSLQELRISALEDEVVKLRAETYKLNVFYKGFCMILSAAGLVAGTLILKGKPSDNGPHE